jgi:hypothetical protein
MDGHDAQKGVSGRMQVVDLRGDIRIVSDTVGLADDLRNIFAWSPDDRTIVTWLGSTSGSAASPKWT